MNVSFFDLKRQYQEIGNEVEKAVTEVCKSCGYIEGGIVKEFEQNMAEYLGVKHVITCGSGTSALELAMRASGLA